MYFIGDTHFGHKNILAYDNRPFSSIEHHDGEIIRRWNNKVTDMNADVYMLGDVSWYGVEKTVEILNQLNGKKHLIVGNHDHALLKSKAFRDCFVEIVDYKELYLDKKTAIVLSHYPIPTYRNCYHGWYHFYAHVHNGYEHNMILKIKQQMCDLYQKPHNMFNVGAMMPCCNFAPVALDEIMR